MACLASLTSPSNTVKQNEYENIATEQTLRDGKTSVIEKVIPHNDDDGWVPYNSSNGGIDSPEKQHSPYAIIFDPGDDVGKVYDRTKGQWVPWNGNRKGDN